MITSLMMLVAPAIVAADGQWAALRQSRTCEAVSRSLGVIHKGRPPARASISFDAGGPRHGQLAVRLSRVPRPGATVMLYVGDQPFLLMNRDDMGWSRGPKQEQAIIAAMRSSSKSTPVSLLAHIVVTRAVSSFTAASSAP